LMERKAFLSRTADALRIESDETVRAEWANAFSSEVDAGSR
jgi:hypothetical protein